MKPLEPDLICDWEISFCDPSLSLLHMHVSREFCALSINPSRKFWIVKLKWFLDSRLLMISDIHFDIYFAWK